MRRIALLLFLLPVAAMAGPQDGIYRNPAGPSLEIQGASDDGFDFALISGAPEGATACPEGAVDCLSVAGHAARTAKFYTYVDPDDATSRIFFAIEAGGVRVVSTTGPLGTGSGNRAAMVKLPGVYAAVVAPAAPTGATGSTASTASDRLVSFRSPTGNIGCLFDVGAVTEVRCDITQLNRSFTRRPEDCDLDWGDSFAVAGGDGFGRLVCHGDTVADPGAEVLDYGSSLSYGGVVCVSAKTGVTCQNAKGHGFTLARRLQRVF
ncbi:hypothetical protein GC209_12405 [bacterium]|nr:hypothetical protein [bacterium]